MPPAAIRMDVEEGDDELKRDLVKEIVMTLGVGIASVDGKGGSVTACRWIRRRKSGAKGSGRVPCGPNSGRRAIRLLGPF
jgi:hypothetical protein